MHLETLLSPSSLANTNIWSVCIASSGLSIAEFIEQFEKHKAMEKSKARVAPPVKDIVAGGYVSKRKTKRAKSGVVETSVVPVDPMEASLSRRVNLKRGKTTEPELLGDEYDKIILGNGVALSTNPSSFKIEGDFGFTENIDNIRKEGFPIVTGYLISQIAKGLQAAVVLNEDVGSSEQKNKILESSVVELKAEVESLRATIAVLEKEASDVKEELKNVKSLLEKEKVVSQNLRIDIDGAAIDAAVEARRDLMVEFVNGLHVHWKPLEKIAKYNAILGEDDVDEGGKEGVALKSKDDGPLGRVSAE